HDLGARADACREPIQVSSRSADPTVRLIGNFAPTPFTLDGRDYRGVESFWQGLKFPPGLGGRRAAELQRAGARAAGEAGASAAGGRRAAQDGDYAATVRYEGQDGAVGTCTHWALMERACWAKFTQRAGGRAALLATGERPLQHRMRRDSRTIPGVIMAEIWM